MIKASIYNFFGKIYIPDDFNFDAPYLLHLSDTPSSIFGSIDSLIKKIQPKIIVHTGDLVDNLKLELYPSSLEGYKRYLKRLIRMLEGGEREVYYVMGNHDHLQSVKKYSHKGHIFPVYSEFSYGPYTYGAGHDIADISPKNADFILYGHNLEKYSDYTSTPKYLNGIEKIALIRLDTGEIITFDYPHGTKESRLILYRKGL